MKASNNQSGRRRALSYCAGLGLSACASMSNKERGAVIGATAGAAVGGVIGNISGSTAKGAIIGAVVRWARLARSSGTRWISRRRSWPSTFPEQR